MFGLRFKGLGLIGIGDYSYKAKVGSDGQEGEIPAPKMSPSINLSFSQGVGFRVFRLRVWGVGKNALAISKGIRQSFWQQLDKVENRKLEHQLSPTKRPRKWR